MKPSRLNVFSQYLVPQHALSSLAGWLSNCRWLWLKNWEIHYFIQRYNVNIQEAQLTEVADYPTFNTRLLKPGLRPIVQGAAAIASPADGSISQIGKIRQNILVQAKGFDFRLEDLLGGNEQLAQSFMNGQFATIYLSPKDYHRVHMPVTGTLRETIFIPGKLFSVNQKTTHNVPQLFARNERLVCIFDTEHGSMALILVGAMLVGSINTAWGDNVCHSTITRQIFSGQNAVTLQRGAEMGHFKMGSTAILLFPPDTINWSAQLTENSPLKMGELLGNFAAP
jgi:phosphatidylserine decarboxylase